MGRTGTGKAGLPRGGAPTAPPGGRRGPRRRRRDAHLARRAVVRVVVVTLSLLLSRSVIDIFVLRPVRRQVDAVKRRALLRLLRVQVRDRIRLLQAHRTSRVVARAVPVGVGRDVARDRKSKWDQEVPDPIPPPPAIVKGNADEAMMSLKSQQPVVEGPVQGPVPGPVQGPQLPPVQGPVQGHVQGPQPQPQGLGVVQVKRSPIKRATLQLSGLSAPCTSGFPPFPCRYVSAISNSTSLFIRDA